MLTAFEHLDKDIDFGEIDDELTLEAVANRVFFKENILSYSTFDSDFDSDFHENNSIKPVSQDKNNTLQYTHSYSSIRSCNSSYAQEKPVKILDKQIVIP